MKKSKVIIGMIMILLGGISCLLFLKMNFKNKEEIEPVMIEGDSFAILLDGKDTNALPAANAAYLVNYTCDNKSQLDWNRTTGELTLSKNTKVAENCTLTFKTNPLVSEVKQGSYVKYTGSNGCKSNTTGTTGTSTAENGNSCSGYNANAPDNGSKDTDNDTYGYCYDDDAKYYVSGWRVAYTDNDRAYIISAGAPECMTRTSSNGNATFITSADTAARKYCNSDYVDNCSNDEDVHAMDDNDFNKITKQATSTTGGYLYTEISDATKCGDIYSKTVCGYNNDLIDNGGYYWFAAAYSTSNSLGVDWSPYSRRVSYSSNTGAFGLRPVIRLKSSVKITGGSGTMDDPYTITNS